MRRTIIAANVLLIACAAALHVSEPGRPDAPAARSAEAATACREAWPYVAAACGGQSAARPVRVLRADAAR